MNTNSAGDFFAKEYQKEIHRKVVFLCCLLFLVTCAGFIFVSNIPKKNLKIIISKDYGAVQFSKTPPPPKRAVKADLERILAEKRANSGLSQKEKLKKINKILSERKLEEQVLVEQLRKVKKSILIQKEKLKKINLSESSLK